MSPRLVLASASPRRRELLRDVVAEFEVAPTDIPEPLGADGPATALALALAKARAAAALNPGAVVLAADTVVYDEQGLLGKPEDAADAVAMLRRLAGRTHRVATGVAAVANGRDGSEVVATEVTMAPLAKRTIALYVASGRPLDKAGAYAIQDMDVPTVARWDGCYCNVVCLPLWAVARLLGEQGVSCTEPTAATPYCAACPDRRPSQA